jgi:hypothetical protein
MTFNNANSFHLVGLLSSIKSPVITLILLHSAKDFSGEASEYPTGTRQK